MHHNARYKISTNLCSRPLPNRARMSLQHVPYAQHQARLSLVPEGPSQHLPRVQTVRADTVQELTSPKLSPASRTNSDTQLYGPIRRRSLLQHGVATRKTWVDSDSRKSLPSQVVKPVEIGPRYNSAVEEDAQSQIRRPSVEPVAMDNICYTRVATPDSMDYSHLGTFKLGSLRITNGAASPEIILERASTIGVDGDYISAGHAREKTRNDVGQRSQTIPILQDNIKSPWLTRTESPLQTVECAEPKSLPLAINTALDVTNPTLQPVDSPSKTAELAQEYRDLTISPFSFEHSPKLEARSKHMAAEDDLFEPEPGTPEVTLFPPRKSIDSGFQPEESEKAQNLGKGGKELPRKPLAKADSGYSSNVSIRSFKKAPAVPAKEAPPTPPKGPMSRVASSTYSVASDAGSTKSGATIKAKSSLPALPKADMLQSFGKPPKVPMKKSFPNLRLEKTSRTTTTKSEKQILAKSKNHGRSKSTTDLSSSGLDGQRSRSSSGSDASSGASSSRWRRNSKSKVIVPLPQVYTCQATPSHAEQMNIPVPSAEASRHLEQRVDSFPVASIPNLDPALRKSVSKETLKTIFSVGSAEYREELTMKRLQSALPPPPTPIAEEPRREDNDQRTHLPYPSVPIPISRKPIHRHSYDPQTARSYQDTPQHNRRRDFETEVTSFESISSSLGSSPYDAAILSSDMKTRREHRTKSMSSQLEAGAAAQFIQARTSPSPARSLRKTTSYGSMNHEDRSSSPLRPASTRSFGRPPSAHGNGNVKRLSQLWPADLQEPQAPVSVQQPPTLRPSQRSITNLREEKNASVVSLGRMKSPPPVSMKTQGRIVQQKPKPSPRPSPPKAQSTPTPSALLPNRIASQNSSPVPSVLPKSLSTAPTPAAKPAEPENSAWSAQQSYWASRKLEAIKTRKSLEMQRPEQARLSFEMAHGIHLQRPASARPSVEMRRPGKFNSWDTSNQTWDGYANQTSEYDHTYGSYTSKGQQEVEAYYDDTEYHRQQEQIPKAVHGRSTSTSDMFSLNGFGLDFDSGFGSPAPEKNRRKSGTANADSGVVMSDVPVFRF